MSKIATRFKIHLFYVALIRHLSFDRAEQLQQKLKI